MRRLTHIVFIIMFIFSVGSCKKAMMQQDLPPSIQLGGEYYTQFVIRYEKGRHRTTNYRRGAAIPVNTKVKLLEISKKVMLVEILPNHQQLEIVNVRKHTNDDIYQAFAKLFARDRVNLSVFTKIERQHIKNGTVAKGMRKKAVLVAIGYPPQIETMNTDSDHWTYWSSRWNKFIVHFSNGKVVKIQD